MCPTPYHVVRCNIDMIGKPNHFIYYTFSDLRLRACILALGRLFARCRRKYIFFYASKVSRSVELLARNLHNSKCSYLNVCGGKMGVEWYAAGRSNSIKLGITKGSSQFKNKCHMEQNTDVFPPSPMLTAMIPSPKSASPFCSKSLGPQLDSKSELLSTSA